MFVPLRATARGGTGSWAATEIALARRPGHRRAVREATDGTGLDARHRHRRRKLFNSVIATLRDGGRSTVIASAGNPVGFLHLLELYRFERTISDVDTGHMTLTKAARVLDVLRPRVRVRGAARSPDANFPL